MDNDGCTPSVKRIKSFLGMVFYYQHFIPNCSSVSKPLFSLTAGQKRRGKLSKDRKFQGTYRKLAPSDWTTECQVAFDKLKAALLECVMLAHPDFNEPFILSVDASLDGLGAVLLQVPKGELRARPIAFASKTLSTSQRRYPAHRLEFMALKWSVCEKFSHWLKGHKFTIWTDNNPLTYLLTKPKLDAYELRWVSKLAAYTFDLKHLPGKANVVADTLSRDPFVEPIGRRLLSEPYSSLMREANGVGEDSVHDVFRVSSQVQPNQPMKCLSKSADYNMEEIRALCQSHCSWTDGAESRALHLVHHVQKISGCQETLPVFSAQELKESQQEDLTISKVLSFLIKRRHP
ncbi:Retrovirus-related Pol polyprotein from transposon 412 [Labeo rohita]|nr:Retrovirus-related Pol polyprotein from transposon 412 [Labeo rohita]